MRLLVALDGHATSSRLSTTGELRGRLTRTNLRARSGRSRVLVKKNLSAEATLFTVGTGTPASLWAS